jgi:hypothetical protein
LNSHITVSGAKSSNFAPKAADCHSTPIRQPTRHAGVNAPRPPSRLLFGPPEPVETAGRAGVRRIRVL